MTTLHTKADRNTHTHTHKQCCQNNLIAFHAYLFCPQRAALVTGHVKAVSNFTEIIRACQLLGGGSLVASLPRPLLQLTLESGKKPNQSVGGPMMHWGAVDH